MLLQGHLIQGQFDGINISLECENFVKFLFQLGRGICPNQMKLQMYKAVLCYTHEIGGKAESPAEVSIEYGG